MYQPWAWVSSTMSLSLCSQTEFCCHAATQLHSIILRSIKRCVYPGRRESCLSFHSHCFSPLFCLLRLTTLRSSDSSSPSLSLTPNPFLLYRSFLSFPSLFLFQSPLHSILSPPWRLSCNDEGAQYQGKSLQGVCSLFSFIFLSQSFGFLEHSTVTNIKWGKYDTFSASLFKLICSLSVFPIIGSCLHNL